MIEEEDDEDVLKKGVTLKSVLKNLLLIILIIVGVVLIYSGIGPDPITSWSIGFMLICFGATLLQIQKTPAEPIRQTLSILICNICGLTKIRNYEKGDFVYRRMGKCDKCNELMEIKEIYSVRLKKSSEPKKSSKKNEKKSKPKEES
ncbi:MAG: hypothetical protein ACFFEN_12665 [Candidatus Thorarchaeota archaeon]